MAKTRGLYQRPGSEYYYLDYLDASGRRVRESSKTTDRAEAQRVLDDRRGRVARGETVLPRADRITFDEARQNLIEAYEAKRTRDMQELTARLAHVTRFFNSRRLVSIKTADGHRYTIQRRGEGAADGTIINELDLLIRVLRVAYNGGKLERLPKIEKPKAAPARSGFVNDDQFEAIRANLPDDLKVFASVAYTLGWRKNEILGLKRHQYDSGAGTLRLDPGTTKNKDGRLVHVPSGLRAMLDGQLARVRALELQQGRVIPWLFPHLDGHEFAGNHQVDPRRAWARACRAAGVPGILIHDLRRSAIRNMEQAGVPRSVATKITGHRTEKIYVRYAITSDDDMRAAVSKIEARSALARRRA